MGGGVFGSEVAFAPDRSRTTHTDVNDVAKDDVLPVPRHKSRTPKQGARDDGEACAAVSTVDFGFPSDAHHQLRRRRDPITAQGGRQQHLKLAAFQARDYVFEHTLRQRR